MAPFLHVSDFAGLRIYQYRPVLLRVQEDQGKAEGLVCGQWSQGPRGALCSSDILIMMISGVCCSSLAVGYFLKYKVYRLLYSASFLSQFLLDCVE